MKRSLTYLIILLVLLGALQTFQLAIPVKAQDQYYYREITITNNDIYSAVNAHVKIVLDSSNFDFSKITDITEIRFYDQNGNELPYWVEYYNTAEPKAIVIVKLEGITVPAWESTKIEMRYPITTPSELANNASATLDVFMDFESSSELSTFSEKYIPWPLDIFEISNVSIYGAGSLHFGRTHIETGYPEEESTDAIRPWSNRKEVIEFWLRPEKYTDSRNTIITFVWNNGTNYLGACISISWSGEYFNPGNVYFALGEWYKIRILTDGENDYTVEYYDVQGNLIGSGQETPSSTVFLNGFGDVQFTSEGICIFSEDNYNFTWEAYLDRLIAYTNYDLEVSIGSEQVVETQPSTCLITLDVSPSGSGRIIVDDYPYESFPVQIMPFPNETIKLYAEPYTGYEFKYWDVDGVQYTDNPLILTASSNMSIIAYFEQRTNETQTTETSSEETGEAGTSSSPEATTYLITIDIQGKGYVLIDENYSYFEFPIRFNWSYGETHVLEAKPADGYKLTKWIINGIAYADNPIKITVTGDMDITAIFEEVLPSTETWKDKITNWWSSLSTSSKVALIGGALLFLLMIIISSCEVEARRRRR